MNMKKFITKTTIAFWLVEVFFALGMLLDNNFLFIVSISIGVIAAVVSVIRLFNGKISIESLNSRSLLRGLLDCSFTVFVGISCMVAGYEKLGICSFVFGLIQLLGEIPVRRSKTNIE